MVVQEQSIWYDEKPGTYQYVLVCTSMYQYIPSEKVHTVMTDMYYVCTRTMSCMLNTNRGTWSVLEHHLIHVMHTQYRFQQSYNTKSLSIIINIFVNMVHTHIYWYIISTYPYIPVDQHVLYLVK